MTEPPKVSELAHDRAKTILQNSDLWSSPNAAKASAEALSLLGSVVVQFQPLEPKPEPVKVERPTKPEKTAKPAADEQPESADA